MSFLAFLAAAFFFLIAAIAPLFDWIPYHGDFHPFAWGLLALTFGFILRHEQADE